MMVIYRLEIMKHHQEQQITAAHWVVRVILYQAARLTPAFPRESVTVSRVKGSCHKTG